MKLLMIVPGFGNPIDTNGKLLMNNLRLLSQTRQNIDIDVKIYCFVEANIVIQTPLDGIKIEIFYETGVIGEFLYRHIQPSVVKEYDYVIISMDDMELMPEFNLFDFISDKRVDWEIISPCLTNDSVYTHEHMLKGSKTGLAFHENLELFFYIMTKDAYIHYFDVFINDPNINWLWGVDAIFGRKGFKSYINFDSTMRHHHIGASRNPRAVIEVLYNLDKHLIPNCIIQFGEIEETSWKEFNPEFNYILITREMERKIVETYFVDKLEKYDKNRDIVKYVVLYLEGGICVDAGVICKKSYNTVIETMEKTFRKDGITNFGFEILFEDGIIISKKKLLYWKNLI